MTCSFPTRPPPIPCRRNERRTGLDPAASAMSSFAPGADPEQVLAKLRALMDRSFDPARQQGIHQSGSQVLDSRLTPFRDDHLSHRPLWQHDAAGELDHCLWLRRHRRPDPAGGLLQLHQSGHGARHDASPGNRLRKVLGARRAPIDGAVPGRVGPDRADRAGVRAGPDRDFASRFRPHRWASRSTLALSCANGRFFWRCSVLPSWPGCRAASIRRWCCRAFGPPACCAPTQPGNPARAWRAPCWW